MVSYTEVKAHNVSAFSNLPEGLVAVFVGGTNGIGEYTLRQFAEHAKSPRVYFVGRSQEAGSRIAKECGAINPSGTFNFIKADTSLMPNVDKVCQDIQSKESSINLLFLSTGTLDFYTQTSEGLPLAVALTHYSRARFILNFLPQLQAAKSLKSVVSVFAGTKEGPLFINDIHGKKVPLMKGRGHMASLVTAAMMTLAQQAPDVSFVHTFPGPVKSGIGRDMQGIVGVIVRALAVVLGPIFNIPTAESGAYHLYFATSERYCSKQAAGSKDNAPGNNKLDIARGIDGNKGSGLYCISEKGDSASPAVEQLFTGLKQDGSLDKVWEDLQNEWKRILDGSKGDGSIGN